MPAPQSTNFSLRSTNDDDVEPTLAMYHVEPGYGTFDTGAAGNAVSKAELEKLTEEDPDACLPTYPFH